MFEYLLLSYKSSSAIDWGVIIELVHSNNNHDLVQTIISEPPIYDGEGDETINKMAWCGPHLLHYAIRRNAPYDFVIELIQQYPPAMEVLVDEWYPLYYACITNQPVNSRKQSNRLRLAGTRYILPVIIKRARKRRKK